MKLQNITINCWSMNESEEWRYIDVSRVGRSSTHLYYVHSNEVISELLAQISSGAKHKYNEGFPFGILFNTVWNCMQTLWTHIRLLHMQV